MMCDCRCRDAEHTIVGFGNKHAGIRVAVGNDATLNEYVGPGDIRPSAAVHVILHLPAGTAARFGIERLTVDISGGWTPELVVHFVAARGAIHVRDVSALVVIAGVSVSAAGTILAIYVVVAALARKAVSIPESIKIGIMCVVAICDSHPAHGDIVRRFIAFDTRREIIAVLTS